MHPSNPREIAEYFLVEGIGKTQEKVFDECLAIDVVVETGLSPAGPILGRQAYKDIFFPFADAWPVRTFVLHRLDVAGHTVAAEFTATAEFAKDYYGVAATHQLVPMREIHRLDLREGRIARNLVGAVSLPFEYLMYPVLRDLVLGGLARAPG